jgi:L-cysteine/cystine lyase
MIWALDWRPGDRAVTTNHEHPGCLGPLVQVRDRLGVDLRLADIGDGGDDDRTLAAIEAAIGSGARLVALSHVLWTTGAVLPIDRIARLAHDRGALLVVDGAQSAGAIRVDVDALGVDGYAIPSQKWLLGPEGMGALYVAPGAIEHLKPAYAGYLTYERIDATGQATVWPAARRFEWSNHHGPSVAGFARSCGWLSMFVGLDWLYGRAGRLARSLAERLAAIPGVTVVTPIERMATLITFRIEGWEPAAAADELGGRVFAIIRTIPALGALRASVGAFNSEAELERFTAAVELLAGHTPASLPPRRLAVLGSDR